MEINGLEKQVFWNEHSRDSSTEIEAGVTLCLEAKLGNLENIFSCGTFRLNTRTIFVTSF